MCWLKKERDFLVRTNGGLDGYGVGVTSLFEKLESSEDGVLIGSLGVIDLHSTPVFLFFGKEEEMIGRSSFCFFWTTTTSCSTLCFFGIIRGP